MISASIIEKFDVETVGIYCKMVRLSLGKSICISFLSKTIGINERRMRKVIVGLEEEGYITRKPLHDERGKIYAWNYELYAEPIKKDKRTQAGKPTLHENHQGGKPTKMENGQGIISNNDIIYNNTDNNSNINIPVNNKKEKSLSNDKPKKEGFQKPTVQEVQAYINEKGYDFDAEYFIDYYDTRGWMIGKNHIKDWKACCRTWNHNRKSQEKEKEEKENPDTSTSDWDAQMRWLEKNTPNIAGRMTKEMLRRFKELCFCDKYLLVDTLREFDKIYDGGDMMKEFEELCKKR